MQLAWVIKSISIRILTSNRLFRGVQKMKSNLWTVLLIGIILALLIPLLGPYCMSEQAFTHDNLIRIDLVSR